MTQCTPPLEEVKRKGRLVHVRERERKGRDKNEGWRTDQQTRYRTRR
jgi:hypothetical protein